jgi:hypothetical protein
MKIKGENLLNVTKKILALTGIVILISCTADKDLEDFKSNGIRIDQDQIIAYFPKDIFTEKRMNDIVDTINLGRNLINELISGSTDWQMYKDQQTNYYFMQGSFIAHTSKSNAIYIPVWLVEYGPAPWLHEDLHILLRSKKGFWWPMSLSAFFKMPQWLTEGMAEYLAMRISYENQMPKVDVLKIGDYLTVDSICYENLKGEHGHQILKHIGKPGIMVKLHGKNRREYAPTFYGCSCSFTKYIAETYGLDILLKAYSEYKHEHKTIEELTGKTMKELKKEWLLAIKQN